MHNYLDSGTRILRLSMRVTESTQLLDSGFSPGSNHHSAIFLPPLIGVKSVEILCLMQFDSTLAKVQLPLRLS